MKYYIAYGSNLNKGQMEYRCPDAEIFGTAMLEGWQLMFKGSKTGSYLTIEERKDAKTPVAIWAVTQEDELRLDTYEGFPKFYYKHPMSLKVKKTDGTYENVKAFAYIMNPARPYGVPTQRYIDTCVQGYIDFNFDDKYLSDAINKTFDAMRSEAV